MSCSASDLGAASLNITNPSSSEACRLDPTGTWAPTGNISVAANSNDRYDLGFYISLDGVQAETGNCWVDIIENDGEPGDVWADLDGDGCGDHPKLAAAGLALHDIEVPCLDSNGNGFLDVILCASYDNNSNTPCNDEDEAIPGTGAKCQCLTVDSDVPVPQCETNADCPDDTNVCTSAVCLGLGEPGTDLLGCALVNNTAPCDDGTFCNGADLCAGGACTHTGDPCAGAGVCSVCNEAGGNCFGAGGVPCRAAAGVCDVAESCTGSSATCPANQFMTGPCRASTGVCDPAEACTGSSAACPADAFTSSSSVCRGAAGECDVAENCTGSSGACPANGFRPSGFGCTDDGNVCTDDECDGAGACGHADNTDPCDDGAFCTVDDVCAAGSCGGVDRDCSDPVACSDDTCDEAANECVHTENDANCDDSEECTEDLCVIAQGGCVSDWVCTADICRSPGFWATHSGYEKTGKSVNVGQSLLDLVGGLEVCGEEIAETSNAASPYMDGLGLESALQGLCMRTRGVKQRQLYRQLVAAGLNCAVSGGADDCDSIVGKYVEVNWSDCSDLCAGMEPANPVTIGKCVSQLDCFNNGGRVVDGDCVTGTCEHEPLVYCGRDAGECPLYADEPQECVPFEGNCHAAPMCNEALGFCPKSGPASSPKACREARFDACTIDACN